jgi:hypothetical protein
VLDYYLNRRSTPKFPQLLKLPLEEFELLPLPYGSSSSDNPCWHWYDEQFVNLAEKIPTLKRINSRTINRQFNEPKITIDPNIPTTRWSQETRVPLQVIAPENQEEFMSSRWHHIPDPIIPQQIKSQINRK